MTDFEEQIRQNLENDWGAAAQHSEYKIGDQLRYQTTSGIYTGTIMWIAARSPSSIVGREDIPMRYIVHRESWSDDSFPDVVYSADIVSQEPEELTLVKCRFCAGHHYRGQEMYCPLNPNRPV